MCGLPNRLMGRSVLHVRGDRAGSPVPRSPVLRTADQSREPWRSWRGQDGSREGGGAAQAVTERGHIRAYRSVPLFPAELFLQSEARENDGGRRCCPSTIRTQDWKYKGSPVPRIAFCLTNYNRFSPPMFRPSTSSICVFCE